MIVECHIIQNFPPHCLNRDDSGSPKDTQFGLVRRARISSQCWKRAMREAFESYAVFSEEQKAIRTKRVVEAVVQILSDRDRDPDRDLALAPRATQALLSGVKLKTDEPTAGGLPKTQYLLFLPKRNIERLADLVEEHWKMLIPQAKQDAEAASATSDTRKGKKKAKSKSKSEKASELPLEARRAAEELLSDSKRAPEIALFGRMIADRPSWDVDAACQVAHPISTHRVAMEFDFYTAVDDLRGEEVSGSDMLGTIQFNSACFYRYAALDVAQLRKSLGGPEQEALTRVAVEAFLEAFVRARPSGKQNSMAANTLPHLVLLTARERGQPMSLANAFDCPVRVDSGREARGLTERSCEALVAHLRQLRKMYGDDCTAASAAAMYPLQWGGTGVTSVDSVPEAVQVVCQAAHGASSVV